MAKRKKKSDEGEAARSGAASDAGSPVKGKKRASAPAKDAAPDGSSGADATGGGGASGGDAGSAVEGSLGGDLGEQVEALLRDVEATEKQIESSMRDPSPEHVDLEAIKAEAELAASVDAASAEAALAGTAARDQGASEAGGADLDALLADVRSAVEGEAAVDVAGAASQADEAAGDERAALTVVGADAPTQGKGAQAEVVHAAGAEPNAPEAAGAPDSSEEAETDVDSLVDEMVASAQREASAHAGDAGLASSENAHEETPAAVEAGAIGAGGDAAELTTDASAARPDAVASGAGPDGAVIAATQAPQAPVPAIVVPTASVEDVDAQIANATEELLAHEPARASDADTSAAIVEAEASAAPVARSVAAEASAHSKPEAKHGGASAGRAAGGSHADATNSRDGAEREALAHGPSKARAAARSLSHRAVRALSPHALKAARLVSAPLAKKPRAIRDAVGWIAANTVFLGACLWVYVLFVRGPHAADARAPAFDFQRSGLPRPEMHDEHAAGDGHGTDGAHGGGDAHGAKKDDGHAKKDDGHGKKDKKKEERKPLIDAKRDAFVVNNATDPKKKAEAAKKKDAAKGGGH
jgi:hypothetical protein